MTSKQSVPIPDDLKHLNLPEEWQLVSPHRKFKTEEMGNPVVMEVATNLVRQEMRRQFIPKVFDLLRAGWSFDIVHEEATEPYQWAWRSPPKRKGSNGRRYASTSQAIAALEKLQKNLG